jgi:hypothetical protein
MLERGNTSHKFPKSFPSDLRIQSNTEGDVYDYDR